MTDNKYPSSEDNKSVTSKDPSNVVDWEALAPFMVEFIEMVRSGDIPDFMGPKTEQSKEKALKTLLIAEKDFETAKLLYSNHDFPNTALYLQKGVEKLAKGFAGEEFPLKDKEIYKRTSHNTPLIFLKLMQNPHLVRFLKEFSQVVPGLDTKKLDEIDKVIEMVKNIESKKQTAKIPADFISRMLDIAEVMMNLEGKIKDINSISMLAGRDVKALIQTNLESILGSQPEFAEKAKEIDVTSTISDFLRDKFDRIVPLLILNVPIFALAIITYAHKSFTEYADNEMTPSDYTEDLGIIQSFDRIHDIGLKVCSKLIEIYEKET